jgi:hypothetical protein
MRRRAALWFSICSLACGCAAGLTAPAALASGSSTVPTTTQPGISLLNPGSLGAATTTTPAPTAPAGTSSASGGLSTLDELVIGIVAALVFVVIGYAVQRDARSHLARSRHADRDPALYGQRAHPGSKAPRKARKPRPAERRRRRRGRAR